MCQLTGRCACGAVRFEVATAAVGAGACHCTDCQKAMGGSPSYAALVPRAAFSITAGEPRYHATLANSGNKPKRYFCADCGTPLWSVPDEGPLMPIMMGALDDHTGIHPNMHIFTSSAPTWHAIPDDEHAFPEMPPPVPETGNE